MSRFDRSITPTYFDELYAGDPDPWRFAESAYERDKYAATLAALPRARYARALEIGCSIGILTRQIANRCDAVVALDVAEAALTQARTRCADQPHVRFERRQVPGDWPEGHFDLVLLSEVVYYLDAQDVGALAYRLETSATPGADLVLVHWLGETHYPLTGDQASDLLITSLRSARGIASRREDAYRLDVLRIG